jgi:hypothetical protein
MRFTHVALALTASALMSCSTPQPSEEETLKQVLLGKWCLRGSDGQRCNSHEEILADGSITACAIVPDLPELMRVSASYTIKQRTVCFKVTESNDPLLPLRHAFCVDVLSVDQATYRYRLHGEDTDEVMYRLPANAPSCPSQ